MVRSWLLKSAVAIAPTRYSIASTATHSIHLNPRGRRSWYYTGERVRWTDAIAIECNWLLLSAYGASDARDVAPMLELVQRQRERGARVILDPGPWLTTRVSIDRMDELLGAIDFVCATEEELASWFPCHDIGSMADRCLERVLHGVVIKQGASGASFLSRDGFDQVPTEPLQVANTVGAGDTFNARLVFGLASGESLADAVAQSVSLASKAVERGRGVLGLFD